MLILGLEMKDIMGLNLLSQIGVVIFVERLNCHIEMYGGKFGAFSMNILSMATIGIGNTEMIDPIKLLDSNEFWHIPNNDIGGISYGFRAVSKSVALSAVEQARREIKEEFSHFIDPITGDRLGDVR